MGGVRGEEPINKLVEISRIISHYQPSAQGSFFLSSLSEIVCVHLSCLFFSRGWGRGGLSYEIFAFDYFTENCLEITNHKNQMHVENQFELNLSQNCFVKK